MKIVILLSILSLAVVACAKESNYTYTPAPPPSYLK